MGEPDTPAPESLDAARDQADATDAARDQAPKRKRAPRKRAPRKRADAAPRAPRAPALKGRIESFLVSAGALVLLFNPRDGQAIIAGAPKQAAALDQLAKENPAVKRALERMLTASVYGQLVAAFAPTVLTIAANHGAVPPIVAQLVGAGMGASTPAPADGDDAGDDAASAMFAGIDPADLANLAASMMGAGDGAPRGVVVGMG